MNIRVATPDDILALAAIEKAQPRCAQWGKNGWKTELAEKSARVFCAQEKTVVGFVALRLAAGVGEILNVGVLPEFTRCGTGTLLLSHALAWAKANGGEAISLEVAADNLVARRLYEKCGFVTVGCRKNFYGNGEDALIMGLKL